MYLARWTTHLHFIESLFVELLGQTLEGEHLEKPAASSKKQRPRQVETRQRATETNFENEDRRLSANENRNSIKMKL